MKTTYKILICLLLFACSRASAQTVFKGLPMNLNADEKAALSKVFKKQIVAQFNTADIYNLVKQSGEKSRFILKIENQFSWDITIQQHDLRSPDYVHQQTTKNGLITLPRGECTTYAGWLDNDFSLFVRMSIRKEKFTAFLRYQGNDYFIEPVRNFIKTEPANRYVIYKRGDVIHHGETCGGGTIAEKTEQKVAAFNKIIAIQSAVCRKIEIATESDYECWDDGFGTDDIQSNLNDVEPLYQDNFNASFSIRYQHEWTTDNDPYTVENVCDDNPTNRLAQFRDYWNINFSYVPRDLAFMYTGIDFDGDIVGCAYRGSFAYDTDDSSTYGTIQETQPFLGFSADTRRELAAHEIGHIFGCEHDDNCSGTYKPIMCPDLDESCQFGCTDYWSQRSKDSINTAMASINGSNKFRLRIFPFLNTFTAPATFSGNIFRFSAAYNTVSSGSATFSIVDSATFLPGFDAVAGTGPLSFVIGNCDLNNSFTSPGQSNTQTASFSKINKNYNAENRILVYPNPFSAITNLELDLLSPSMVTISVYDLKGKLLDKPVEKRLLDKGINNINYTNSKLSAGVYLFVVDIDGKHYTQRVIKM